jgi:hypothetical protein
LFNLVFDTLSAFNQAGLIFGGLLFTLVGFCFLIEYFTWRIKGTKVSGEIAGISVKNEKKEQSDQEKTLSYNGEYYYPIYEYKDRQGQKVRAYGDIGTGMLSRLPGEKIKFYISHKDPSHVRRAGFFGLILGLIFMTPGLVLFYIAFKNFEFTLISAFVFIGFMGLIAAKLLPKSEHGLRAAMAAQKEKFLSERRNKVQKKQMEGRELTADELKARIRYWDKIMRLWMPVYIAIAAGMIYGGYYWSQNYDEFAARALAAQGQISGFETKTGTEGGITYSAKVRFKDQNQKSYSFTDKVSSSHPSLKTGDRVKVLYDPAAPSDAIIDRGFLNKLPMAALMGAGVLFLYYALRAYLRMRGRKLRV